jgi:hypothetical protein
MLLSEGEGIVVSAVICGRTTLMDHRSSMAVVSR